MKIQCDVCNEEGASVFCCADEAALCGRCDKQIHSANKLSEKHRRFSLLNPASHSSSHDPMHPLCDICQEKRGFFFCKEDRAILCMDCNVSIHNANVHAIKHNRFLLSGVRVSSDKLIAFDGPADSVPKTSTNSGNISSTSTDANSSTATMIGNSSSSISEYLTKLLPGWHVEDFLFDDAANINKNNDIDEMFGLPIWVPNPNPEYLVEGNNIGCHDQNINKRHRNCMVPQFCGMGQGSRKRYRN